MFLLSDVLLKKHVQELWWSSAVMPLDEASETHTSLYSYPCEDLHRKDPSSVPQPSHPN